jgi:hypothetical protein
VCSSADQQLAFRGHEASSTAATEFLNELQNCDRLLENYLNSASAI